MKPTALKDIDWNLLWQIARKKNPSRSKTAATWDKRAPSFARRNAHSIYNEKFIELLQPEPDWTVLDVGCGPGTLSIPLAKRIKHVSALDYSPKMLEIIIEHAKAAGIHNISTHNLSWADDWEKHGIKVHDVTIASRSLAVDDLRPAIEKLNRFARKSVVICDKVGHGPVDPEAYRAIGRELITGPDYIYTINLLYQMGIRATVDFIPLKENQTYASLDQAVESHQWMFHDLTGDEKKRLKKYVLSITTTSCDGKAIMHRQHVPTWAFIRWSPEPADCICPAH